MTDEERSRNIRQAIFVSRFAIPMASIALIFVVYLVFVDARMRGAIRMMRGFQAEFSLEQQLGYNSKCESYLAVGFWQQGPQIPERQGYICGGIITERYIVIVPFEEGLTKNSNL